MVHHASRQANDGHVTSSMPWATSCLVALGLLVMTDTACNIMLG